MGGEKIKPAVFLDRDGTLIEHVHYLRDPADVKLVDGAGEALRLFRAHGLSCVVVTNQSAIGRGMLTEAELVVIHEVMVKQLADEGVTLEGIYHCPQKPRTDGDRLVVDHPDRKPGPGMLIRAAEELGLALSRSFMVGDMLSDVFAGTNAGVRASVLIQGQIDDDEIIEHLAAIDFVADNLRDAAEWICAHATDEDDEQERSAT